MKSIDDVRNNLIDTLYSINLDKLSVFELKAYAEVMKIAADTRSNDYFETLVDKFSSSLQIPSTADMK